MEQAQPVRQGLAAADVHILPHIERMLPILGVTRNRVCEKVLNLWAHQHGQKSGWKKKRKWKLGALKTHGESEFVYERRCRHEVPPNSKWIARVWARFKPETKVQLGVEFYDARGRNRATVHLYDEKLINGRALPQKG